MKRVELAWPDELVAQIDEARGDVSRSAWLKRAAEARLSDPRSDQVAAVPLRLPPGERVPAGQRQRPSSKLKFDPARFNRATAL